MTAATKHGDYVVVAAHDVEDGKLVAGQLRALQREVHSGFELITNRLMTSLERIEAKLDDLGVRVGRLERDQDDHRKRLSALEAMATNAENKRLRARK